MHVTVIMCQERQSPAVLRSELFGPGRVQRNVASSLGKTRVKLKIRRKMCALCCANVKVFEGSPETWRQTIRAHIGTVWLSTKHTIAVDIMFVSALLSFNFTQPITAEVCKTLVRDQVLLSYRVSQQPIEPDFIGDNFHFQVGNSPHSTSTDITFNFRGNAT